MGFNFQPDIYMVQYFLADPLTCACNNNNNSLLRDVFVLRIDCWVDISIKCLCECKLIHIVFFRKLFHVTHILRYVNGSSVEIR